MRLFTIGFCLLALLLSAGCKDSAPTENAPENAPVAAPDSAQTKSAPAPKTATPRAEWVTERTQEAQKRLEKSPAGKLLWRSIEAHGGLQTWYANGPVYFRFNYQPVGDKPARDTFQTIDTWSARARHQLPDDKDVEFGWDGKVAWVSPADADPKTDARFWALTPYYFMAMPFVLADPGVNLETQGTAELHGRPHDVIRATFGDNVGDSPDDYYIVYLDAETGHLGGLRYIVSYPGFFPEGDHSPEKLMVYEGKQTVDGITLAERYSTYPWDVEKSERGDLATNTTLTDVEFRPDTLDTFFAPPEGAKILEEK
ncbi:hypothetical protein DN745_04235 [Bradymonas sediminis]|uniref:Outer membrane lipoprotein-sorting protein n=1 Tax=Bradymonas sediminis TaxID=1548548 RepID=A0A2Z4FHX1_9DELT|nr:hypothetical protein DN745_04235 [Bradymonas sediminis]